MDNDYSYDYSYNYTDLSNQDYTDPLFPPDIFTYSVLQNGFWLLYAFGFYVVASAATFITHNFMVKGVMVGLECIQNKKIKSVIEPVLVSVVKCWPKFLIGITSRFIAFSFIGEYSVMGSIAFNLHIGLAVYLLAMSGPQAKFSYGTVFGNLFIIITSIAFVWLIGNSARSPLVQIVLSIGCLVFYGLVVLLPLIRNSCNTSEEQYEEYDLEDGDESESKSSNNCCLPEVPVSILTHGTGFQLFIDWLLYINSMTISFIPFLTLFWCNPSNKRYACLWPAAVVFGGIWVAVLIYLSAWWATVVGNTLGCPPEMSGILLVGPLLSATNLAHLADRKRPFMWHGITEDILADCLLGITLPYLLYCVFPDDRFTTLPVFVDVEVGILCGILIITNIVISHLLTGLMEHKTLRITYGIILILGYPIVFLSGSYASIYQIIVLP